MCAGYVSAEVSEVSEEIEYLSTQLVQDLECLFEDLESFFVDLERLFEDWEFAYKRLECVSKGLEYNARINQLEEELVAKRDKISVLERVMLDIKIFIQKIQRYLSIFIFVQLGIQIF